MNRYRIEIVSESNRELVNRFIPTNITRLHCVVNNEGLGAGALVYLCQCVFYLHTNNILGYILHYR